MSRKNREKQTFIERNFQFKNVQEAENAVKKQSTKLKFTLIMTIITGLITVVNLILIKTANGNENLEATAYGLGSIGVLLMLICLNKDVVKYSIKLMKFSWYVIPIFPIDLFVAVCMPLVVLSLAIYAPVIPCFIPLYQSKVALDEARKFCNSNTSVYQRQEAENTSRQNEYVESNFSSGNPEPTFSSAYAFNSPEPVEIDFSLFE